MLFHVKFESRMFSALIWNVYCAYNSKNKRTSDFTLCKTLTILMTLTDQTTLENLTTMNLGALEEHVFLKKQTSSTNLQLVGKGQQESHPPRFRSSALLTKIL